MIDLHTHTNASDGELSPEELISRAVGKGLKAIAITDHDTVAGVHAALKFAKPGGPEVVPGIEVSCYEIRAGFDEVHILGLFIDCQDKRLIKFTESTMEERTKQKKRIISNLNMMGYEIDFSEIKGIENFSVGRPHIAKILASKYPDEFCSVQDVFDKLIGNGKPAYTKREERVNIGDAVKIIHKAGGKAFLAHPGVYTEKDSMDLIMMFVNAGGDGLETFYPYHASFPGRYDLKKEKEKIAFYRMVAKKHGMLESGGTDFHGKLRDADLGSLGINYSILAKIKESLAKNP